MTNATKYIVYTRVSTKEQGDSRNGLEAQQRAVQEFVAREGGEITHMFEEVISGKFAFDERPVMTQAMRLAAKTGAIILVAKLDRLSRSVEHISTLMNNRKVQFTVANLGSKVGNLELHIHAVIAENERKTIGERTKAALASKMARGEPLGFITHVNPEESKRRAGEASTKAVKADADAFAENLREQVTMMRDAGKTVVYIAEYFNKMGIKTPRGGLWYASSICNLIRRLEGGVLKRVPRCDKK